MRSIHEQHTSLRRRFSLGVSVMILPLIVIGMGAFYTINSSVDSLEEQIHWPVVSVVSVKNLENLVLKAEPPIHQYLSRGEAADREQFNHISVEVEIAFSKLIENIHLNDQQRVLLSRAMNEWEAAYTLGGTLLNEDAPITEAVLMKQLNEFGQRIDRSASLLDDVGATSSDEIRNYTFAAQKIKWQAIAGTMVILGFCILAASLGAFLLFRSIMSPIQHLERSVNRFGQGDLSSRISLNSNDELGHLATAFNAMAERFQQVQKELDYLSVHDSLTGLYDRPKFLEIASQELQRAKRYERAFSILLIDIDKFTSVNDAYGKLVGDSVLCSVALQINSSIRPTDAAARFGGDEFAVILSETHAEGARETAERIAQAISDKPINIGDGKNLSISVSIGISTYPADEDSESALFAQADLALDKAKKSPTSSQGRIQFA